MKARGWPRLAIFAQGVIGLTLTGALLVVDFVLQASIRLGNVDPASPSEPTDGGDNLWIIVGPIILAFLVIYVLVQLFVPVALVGLISVVVGLPIRLVAPAREWWVRHYIPVFLVAAGTIVAVVAWTTQMDPDLSPEFGVYSASSPLFVAGLLIVGIGAWQGWLPNITWPTAAPRVTG